MAQIFPRFPGGKKKALTLSYDDGVEQDVKLIQILNRHGLKGTFNLNSGCYPEEGAKFPEGQVHRRLSAKQAEALYKNSGHEVAVHTRTHPFLERLPAHVALNELLLDREALEEQFNTSVRGMAYPYGTFNDDVVDLVSKAGLVYGRTVETDASFCLPRDWLRLKPTAHHNDAALMDIAQKFVNTEPSADPILFYLWGHSYEFEQNNNWCVIENFAEYMGERPDIWYATNIEIYDYLQAYHRLEFSTLTTCVQNPTAYTIWFVANKKQYCIEPGRRLEFDI